MESDGGFKFKLLQEVYRDDEWLGAYGMSVYV